MAEKQYKITNETGIHARPATVLVNAVNQFDAEVHIESNGKSVNLKSIMGVMSMGIQKGAEVVIKAEGNDAEDALKAVDQIIKDHQLGE